MLDMAMVENTIQELENADTNFANCEKLANLYIIRDHNTVTDNVTEELSDILPHYNIYCEKKRHYQMHKIGEDIVVDALQTVCHEIYEFMQTLYSSTDMIEERALLIALVDKLEEYIK